MTTIRKLLLAASAIVALGYAPNQAYAQYNYGFRNNFTYAAGFSNPYSFAYTRLGYGNSASAAGYLTSIPNGGYGRYGLNTFNNSGYLFATSVTGNRYGTWSNTTALAYNYNSYGAGSVYPPTYIYAPNYAVNSLYNSGVNPYPAGGYVDPAVNTPRPTQLLRTNPTSGTGNAYGDWVGQRAVAEAVKPVAKHTDFSDKEIVSGEAINALVEQIADAAKKRELKDTASVDVAQLNFSPVRGIGQFGYLALGSAEKLPWGDAFDKLDAEGQELAKTLRKQVGELFALNAAKEPTRDLAKEAMKTSSKLSDSVSAQITPLGLTKYTEAKQFLKNLEPTLSFLAETSPVHNWKRGLTAANVADLVRSFTDNQLKAVTALPGSEKAYRDLFAALKKTADRMVETAALE